MIGETEGRTAVRLAREALTRALGPATGHAPTDPAAERPPPIFQEARGVFVTLRRYPDRALRGCVGFPRPVLPLGEAIREASVAAATEDPRFPPVAGPDLLHLTVEVSVLTPPELLPSSPPGARAAAVRPGRDGLIVEGYGRSGLLLPQVAVEQGWTATELLQGTCEKAGLPTGAWRDPLVRVLRFRAEVFVEERPYGPVRRADGEVTPPDVRVGR